MGQMTSQGFLQVREVGKEEFGVYTYGTFDKVFGKVKLPKEVVGRIANDIKWWK